MSDRAERKSRSAGAVRKIHQRWLERRTTRLGAALDGVERFLVAANVGGVVASLSIVATAIGGGGLPSRTFFWVLVVFIFGLLFAWVGRYLDVILAVDIRRASAVWIIIYYIRRGIFWLSAISVVVGTTLGLVELHAFTR